jgi:hypothetical protein
VYSAFAVTKTANSRPGILAQPTPDRDRPERGPGLRDRPGHCVQRFPGVLRSDLFGRSSNHSEPIPFDVLLRLVHGPIYLFG